MRSSSRLLRFSRSPSTFSSPLSPSARDGGAGALSGVRVLDLSRILAGPWCTQQLSDHGAQVIKVEKPITGDDTRHWGPPFTPQSHLSAYFIACNRSKLSCAINLKCPQGRDLVLSLASVSDVLVENFLPGELDRLGLGWEEVHRVAPHCHYASLTSYGAIGPLAKKAGYDVMVSGEGGMLGLTGTEEEPARGGIALTDLLTGSALCTAIVAALFHDRRPQRSPDEPIVGQRIETSLFATQLAVLTSVAQAALIDPTYKSKRYGTAHPSIVPYQAFKCSDGRMIVAGALNNAQFSTLCVDAFHRSDLASDPRFLTNPLRVQHRIALLKEVGDEFTKGGADEWINRLDALKLPCAHINGVRDALNHPQSKALGMVQEVRQDGEDKPIQMVAPSVNLSETPTAIGGGAPALSQHTRWVLKEILGYEDSRIDRFISEAVVQ